MRTNGCLGKTGIVVTAFIVFIVLAVPAAALELSFVTHELKQLTPVADLFNETMAKEGKALKVQLISGKIDKVLVMAAGGAPPDLVEIDLVHGPKLMSRGLMYHLDPLIQRDKYGEFVQGLIPGMARLGQRQGRTYLLPLWADNSMLYYSKTKLAEAGMETAAPRTWDQLVQISRKTTVPEKDMYGFEGLPTLFWFSWLPFLWGNDGRLLSDDGSQALINSPEARQAVQLWYDMRNIYQVTRPEGGSKFREGLDTFFVQGGDKVGGIRSGNPGLEWDVAPIPTRLESQKPSSFIGGGTFGIMTGTKYAEQAWEVMKFFLSPTVQIDIVPKDVGTPVHRKFFQNPYFKEDPVHLKFADAAFFPNSRCPYSHVFAELKVVIPPFEQAVRGEIPVDEAVMNMESLANALLKEAATW